MDTVDSADISSLRRCRHQVLWVEMVFTPLIAEFELRGLLFLEFSFFRVEFVPGGQIGRAGVRGAFVGGDDF